jgi:dienelactone hydrolase
VKMKHGLSLNICITLLLSITLFVGCTGLPEAAGPTPPGSAALSTPMPGSRETVSFQSLSFSGTLWSPLLPPSSEGAATAVSGLLTIPPGRGTLPAVVITHGCSGIGPSELGWADQLNQIGLATFVVQSLGGRQIPEVCSGQHALNIASVLVDAYRALDTLAAHPRINPSQIAIMGFSFGGRTALWTSQVRLHERYGTPGRAFAAHLAFYPTGCYIQLAEETQVTGSPIRIFHGAADDWTPIGQCQEYVERLQDAGKDAALFAYADALHGFDNGYTGMAHIPDALSPRNCTFLEQDGKLIDVATGNEAALSSPCVSRGVTIGYNADAHQQAMRDVKAFLRTLFQLQ